MELLNVEGATPGDDPTAAPLAAARARAAGFRQQEAREAARSSRLSWLRLLAFLGVVGALLVAERGEGTRAAWALAAAAGGGILFLVLLGIHRGIRRRERHAGALAAVNEEAILRIRRNWSALPEEPWGTPPASHPEAEDLYLLGRASLLRLLGPPATVPGRETLTAWLLSAAPPATVRERQAAVKGLAPELEFRDELAARGRSLEPGHPGEVEAFLAWAQGDRWLPGRRLLRVASVVLPLATVGLGWAHGSGLLPALWLFPLLATVHL